MGKYVTRQRKALLCYLSAHPDEILSAKQIAGDLEKSDISLSAVYRNLAFLEEDNIIKRVTLKGSREVGYRYIGNCECRDCLHLSCKKCGRTFHLDSPSADILIKTVAACDGFSVDKQSTVLSGICKKCRDSE